MTWKRIRTYTYGSARLCTWAAMSLTEARYWTGGEHAIPPFTPRAGSFTRDSAEYLAEREVDRANDAVQVVSSKLNPDVPA